MLQDNVNEALEAAVAREEFNPNGALFGLSDAEVADELGHYGLDMGGVAIEAVTPLVTEWTATKNWMHRGQ